jgi:hypothetical protein
MSNVMIGSCACGMYGVSSRQKSCLTKEFRKLYKPAKRYMSRDQKIAIALNKCNVKRK